MNLVEQFDRAFEEARLSPEVKQASESGGGIRLRSEWNRLEQEWGILVWKNPPVENPDVTGLGVVSVIQNVPLGQFLGAFEKREFLKDKMLQGIQHYLLVESRMKRKHF